LQIDAEYLQLLEFKQNLFSTKSFGVLDYDNEDFAIEKPEYSTAKNVPMESSEEELNGYTYSSEEFSHPNSGHHENDI